MILVQSLACRVRLVNVKYLILISAVSISTLLAGCSTLVEVLPQGMKPVKYDFESCKVRFPQLAGLNIASGIARENEKSLTGVLDYCVTQILGKADYGFQWEFTRTTDPFSSQPKYSVLVWEGKGCLLSEQDKSKGTLPWHQVTALETFEGGGCAGLLSAIPRRNLNSHSSRAKREMDLPEASMIAYRLAGVKN